MTFYIIIDFMYIVRGLLAYLSCCIRKPTICICENKDADQLRGKTMHCLTKSKIAYCLNSVIGAMPIGIQKCKYSSIYLRGQYFQ